MSSTINPFLSKWTNFPLFSFSYLSSTIYIGKKKNVVENLVQGGLISKDGGGLGEQIALVLVEFVLVAAYIGKPNIETQALEREDKPREGLTNIVLAS